MAHNLNVNKGKVSFFSVKEKPWHNLGQILDNPATSEEAIREAGLDFEVAKEPVYVPVRDLQPDADRDTLFMRKLGQEQSNIHNREIRQVPDRFATFRTDNGTPFGVVGSRYEVVQNTDAFKFFDAIVGEGEAIFETAGALKDGQIIFITAKLPSYIRVKNNDDIEKYLLLTMTHDGTGSIQTMFTPIRVVCNNTLNAALRSNSCKVSIRHTKSAHNNLKEAHKIMGITNMLSNELSEIYDNLTRVKITDKALREYLETVVLGEPLDRLIGLAEMNAQTYELSTKAKNTIDGMERYYFEGVGQDFEHCRGTLFGAYNAVTGYYQNMKLYKTVEDKMSSVMLGNGYEKGQVAFNLAVNWN